MWERIKLLAKYYRFFGSRGVFLMIIAVLTRRMIEFRVTVPGMKYPFRVRLKTSDVKAYEQVIYEKEYEIALSRPPSVIIDAGANIGLASIYFSNRYPNAKVISVEPEKSNFGLLKKNTAPYPNIIPIQAALWKENGIIELVDPGSGHWGFQTTDSSSIGFRKIHKIQGMTVDKIMIDHGINYIDILKIDIEGAEKEIFENASPWLDKIGVIVIELHERLKEGCNQSVYSATNQFKTKFHRGDKVILERGATSSTSNTN
jgi:FkbM family methyltransferase